MTQAPRPNEDIEARLAQASAAWGAPDAATVSSPEEERPRRNFFVEFLAENWLWIVVPALLVVLSLVGLALYLQANAEGDPTTPFIYATYD